MTTTLRLDRPLAVLALAGSGPDPDRDHLVAVSVLRIDPVGTNYRFTWGLGTGLPRGLVAAPMQGEVDRIAAGHRFAAVASPLAGVLDGCDLLGVSLLRQGLPLLEHAFDDAGVPFAASGRYRVDLLALMRNLPGLRPAVATAFRDPIGGDPLAAAADAYLGRAHHRDAGPEDEARLALDLLDALIAAHPDRLPADVPGLHAHIAAADRRGFLRRVGVGLVLDIDGIPRAPVDGMAVDEHGLAALKRLADDEQQLPDDARALLRRAIAEAESWPEDPAVEVEEDVVDEVSWIADGNGDLVDGRGNILIL